MAAIRKQNTQNATSVMLLGEFARLADVSRQTCYLWACRRIIPARLVGGRYELRRSRVPEILRRLADEGRIVPRVDTPAAVA